MYSRLSTGHLVGRMPQLHRLSPAQLALWYAQAIDPSNAIFNQAEYLEIRGPVVPEVFIEAARIAVAETDALHLRFVEMESGPQQCADPDPNWTLPFFDLSTEPDPAGSARAWMLANMGRADDLEQGHCFTCALLRCAEDRHFYYQRAHHIVCDGAGALIFARRVAALYSALVEGSQRPPSDPGSCFELLDEDEKYRNSTNFERDRDFWQQQLSNLPDPVTLSGKSPTRARRSVWRKVEVHPITVQAIVRAARSQGCSLAQVITAAAAVYIYRITGADDLILGVPVTARIGRRMRSIVGVASDVLPLRVLIDPSLKFSVVLQQVAKGLRDLLRHQRYRSENIRRDLGTCAKLLNLNGTLVNVMSFDYQLQFGQCPSLEHDLAHGPIDDLAILAYDQLDSSSLRLSVFANPDHYSEDELAVQQRRFVMLLSSLERAWDSPVHKLTIADAQERRRLLSGFREGSYQAAVERGLPSLVEGHAARTPDAVAVAIGRQSLSYAQLNERANRLAQYLLQSNLGPQAVIGVAVKPSFDMVTSLLAVLKAGRAYATIDVGYPRGRIARLVSATRPALIITTTAAASILPNSVDVFCLDDPQIETALKRGSAVNPALPIPGSGAACIAYTCANGAPVPVVLSHTNIIRLFESTQPLFAFDADDSWAPSGPGGAETLIWCFWGALIYGGRLVLTPESIPDSSWERMTMLADQRVSVLSGTPATFRPLVEAHPEGGGMASSHALRLVMVTGGGPDVLRLTSAYKIPEGIAPRIVWMHGEPEASIFSAFAELERGPGSAPTTTATASVIPGRQIYVLDAGLELLPFGVAGEMYVAGAVLARGYLSRPGLTAERFVADPHSATPGARMYRTGDIVRWNADGKLEYVGRSDDKVFVTASLVDLVEIEAGLRALPEITHAAVIPVEDRAGEQELIAFVVPQDGAAVDALNVWNTLREQFPSHMVPSKVVPMRALPIDRKGKVDRRALLTARRSLQHRPASDMERLVAAVWKRVLKLEDIGVHENFFEVGGDSLRLTQILHELRKELKQEIKVTDLFQRTTISSVAGFLNNMQNAQDANGHGSREINTYEQVRYRRGRRARVGDQPTHMDDAVAIIGLSCRLPDAANPAEFWRNLCDGHESVRTLTDAEILRANGDPQNRGKRNFVDRGVILDAMDHFDGAFWGYTPRESELLDPQQRIFLECCWEALEDAGYDPSRVQELTGVFAGADLSAYMFGLQRDAGIMNEIGPIGLAVSTDKDYLTTRVAYKLNLCGPAITLQTACSSSLVAVCQACKELILGQCDLALAGGTGAATWLEAGYFWQEGGILSPDGRCRAFDASAAGTIFGSGGAVVLLKRYQAAIENGDHIYAVIRGFAVTNDGSERVGYTAPGIEGQKRAISAALEMSGVHPETISYIEAHGTGTKLGDPIEIAALTQVYRTHTERRQFCAVGSVKTNIGHLGAAAGIAGLVKTALALKKQILPPSLNFEHPNPNIDFRNSPFFMIVRARTWENGTGKRRAGINSFGIGGTNAHVLLEEAPDRVESEVARPWQIFPVSAKTDTALEGAARNLSTWLKAEPNANLADVAYTLQLGRQAFRHRRAVLAETSQTMEAADALISADPQRAFSAIVPSPEPKVVFLFPGQGAQYVGMARDLYDLEPTFREHVDWCSEVIAAESGIDLREILYPSDSSDLRRWQCAEQLSRTEITQPALFTIEYALASLWIRWGVRPDAMVGHSIGEYVAACLAGVFSMPDALRLMIARGRLMQSLPPGAMLAVHLAAKELGRFATNGLSMAAENSPSLCVLSGTVSAIERLEASLAENSVQFSRLRTSHAFHSSMMEPIVKPFVDRIRHVKLKPPSLPFISNLTGTWITLEQATDPEYWGRHLRGTVRFVQNVQALEDGRSAVLLEVGPGRTLTSLARQIIGPQAAMAHSLPGVQDSHIAFRTLMAAVSILWVNGVNIGWSALHSGERRLRVPLPTYPFERQGFWIDTNPPTVKEQGNLTSSSAKPDPAEWFYIPNWKTAPRSRLEETPGTASWIVLGGTGSDLDLVLSGLKTRGDQIHTRAVLCSDAHATADHNAIDPSDPESFRHLVRDALPLQGTVRILFWFDVTPIRGTQWRDSLFETAPEFFSLMYLAKAIGREIITQKVEITVVTRGGAEVSPLEDVCPYQAMLTGAGKVIAQEMQNVKLRVLDLPGLGKDITQRAFVDAICAELKSSLSEQFIALRDSGRWIVEYNSYHLEPTAVARRLRRCGVYVITGGLGGMGLTFARSLAERWQARLILISRSKLPERSEWTEWLTTHVENDGTSRKIREIQAMECAGAEVVSVSADVTDRAAMQDVAALVRARFGGVNGVIHAAGIPGGNLIQLRSTDKAAAVLAPKVKGTEILYEVFATGGSLDFFALCSSLAAILGGFGQIDYAAANAYLDAFAIRHASRRTPVVSIGWDAWDEVGMAVETERRADVRAVVERTLQTAMTPTEGIRVLDCILGGDACHVEVSTRPLKPRLTTALEPPTANTELANLSPAAPRRHPRPALSTAYEAPRTPTERVVAELWSELLGIDAIGINDSFFECGGHSLLAVQLLSKIRDLFPAEIGIAVLFEAPTIAELSHLLDVLCQRAPPDAASARAEADFEHKYL